jgi:hypothetical protein
MVLRRKTLGAYDPVAGTRPQTLDEIAVTGAVFNIDDKRVNGSTVLSGDKEVTLSREGIEIAPVANADEIEVQGERHQIVSVKPLAPGGSVVIYKLQVRRAA